MNPVNDQVPVLAPGLRPVLTCPEGQASLITEDFLSASDADSANASLLFLVARQPLQGAVLRWGVAVDRFVQADVAAGAISYQHNGESAPPLSPPPADPSLWPQVRRWG